MLSFDLTILIGIFFLTLLFAIVILDIVVKIIDNARSRPCMVEVCVRQCSLDYMVCFRKLKSKIIIKLFQGKCHMFSLPIFLMVIDIFMLANSLTY